MIFILLQHHISELPRYFWSTDWSVHCYENSQKSNAKHTTAKRLFLLKSVNGHTQRHIHNKTGNVHINVTLRRVRATAAIVEKQ